MTSDTTDRLDIPECLYRLQNSLNYVSGDDRTPQLVISRRQYDGIIRHLVSQDPYSHTRYVRDRLTLAGCELVVQEESLTADDILRTREWMMRTIPQGGVHFQPRQYDGSAPDDSGPSDDPLRGLTAPAFYIDEWERFSQCMEPTREPTYPEKIRVF